MLSKYCKACDTGIPVQFQHTRLRLANGRMLDFTEKIGINPTVEKLKKYINNVLNIPIQNLVLSYQGNELTSGTLATNRIQLGSVINLVINDDNLDDNL